MRKAFTLAEVLITLGIIGVVAALTMPALISNYKKKVLLTRIKKFYSAYTQAYNMKIANDGELDVSMLTAIDDPDVATEFFNVNYEPYMKIVEKTKTAKGMAAALPDGSGLYIRKSNFGSVEPSTSATYIVFCVEYKKCKSINETPMYNFVDSKETFIFWNGIAPPKLSQNRTNMLNLCKTGDDESCTGLIMYDGWEIKDDYPWKI
ncbi:MAG: type II secretion system GspH family protein [Heliobacteriaceae bacterium]|jgi:prepilin-type N-terminal cleavage/methylation domain-containing protein|nr:type II secretion system GspH family protein [Heliobacteriaceae bacterium]